MQLSRFIIITLVICSSFSQRANRVKRRLIFTKNSKFFLRLNAKENVIPWNQVYAHGWGFRINWALPEQFPRRYYYKRSLQADIEKEQNMQAKIGYSCILKHICEVVEFVSKSEKCGMFCEIGKIILESEDEESELFTSIIGQCNKYINICHNTIVETMESVKNIMK